MLQMNSIPPTARWPRSQLPLLIEALARQCGTLQTGTSLEPPSLDSDLGEWIDTACAQFGLDSELHRVQLRGFESSLVQAAPMLLALPSGEFGGLLRVRGRKVRLITTHLRTIEVSTELLREVICAHIERQFETDIDEMLQECGPNITDPHLFRRAVMQQRTSVLPVTLGWQIRVRPGSSFRRQIAQAGVPQQLWMFGASYVGEYVFLLASWWMIGLSALTGRFDAGWLFAWILMTLCSVAFGGIKSAAIQRMSIAVAGLFKQRLIAGAVRLDADSVRHQGSGHWLARVFETESLETVALGGVLPALAAPVELVSSAALLWLGAGGASHVLLLAACLCVLALFAWRQQTHRARWIEARLEMTDDLIERMNGHRTRLSQEDPSRWHAGEDQGLEQYLDRSVALDRYTVLIHTVVPRLWLLTGLLALTPAFVQPGASNSLAVSIAAVLMAYRSLRTLGQGLGHLGAAVLAWRKVRALFHASEPVQSGIAVTSPGTDEAVLLEARDLTFRYGEHDEPVVDSCNLSIGRDDCILLEGPSGDGKSTLASLLAGLRKPQSGLLLAGGLDHHSLGEARWRRRVALVPQSHENHIFCGSLAFNLLLGRAWPPTWKDLADASAVCRDLGLDALVARMPAGLDQAVGEAGWQLSEGERSRVFLARALLSKADVLILDECFGALDPQSLIAAYKAVRARAKALVLVAHP
jgi:ABC-type multidrug transport system fused ATPase/permease subunit